MIKVITHTAQPLTLMGNVASRCWNSQPSKQIGIDCIESGHGRVLEYPDVTFEFSGYSARVIRELYVHQHTTKLQESTRYVDCSNFDYVLPESIRDNPTALTVYNNIMVQIQQAYTDLRSLAIHKQDCAYILPLGMHTKIVLKINLQSILHMAGARMCVRALKEYRVLMDEFKQVLSTLDEEWLYIVDKYMLPKCEISGYCIEKHSCGKFPKK